MVVKVVTGKVKKCLCLKFLKMTLYSSNGKKLLNEADLTRHFPGMIILAQTFLVQDIVKGETDFNGVYTPRKRWCLTEGAIPVLGKGNNTNIIFKCHY